jgi:hypothetical protein
MFKGTLLISTRHLVFNVQSVEIKVDIKKIERKKALRVEIHIKTLFSLIDE